MNKPFSSSYVIIRLNSSCAIRCIQEFIKHHSPFKWQLQMNSTTWLYAQKQNKMSTNGAKHLIGFLSSSQPIILKGLKYVISWQVKAIFTWRAESSIISFWVIVESNAFSLYYYFQGYHNIAAFEGNSHVARHNFTQGRWMHKKVKRQWFFSFIYS